MEKVLQFGKIAYSGQRRINPVEITVELRSCGGEKTFIVVGKNGERRYTGERTPEYLELAISGTIWNASRTRFICGGQCLDVIAKYRNQLQNKEVFDRLYDYWLRYHLNGAHAGTPEQEDVIQEWCDEGNKYEHNAVCEMLKKRGLYEVNYTGLAVGRRYNNQPYKYGHAWLIQELPGEVVRWVEHLLST